MAGYAHCVWRPCNTDPPEAPGSDLKAAGAGAGRAYRCARRWTASVVRPAGSTTYDARATTMSPTLFQERRDGPFAFTTHTGPIRAGRSPGRVPEQRPDWPAPPRGRCGH